MRASSLALCVALIGCDGERAQRPASPRPLATDDGGIAVVSPTRPPLAEAAPGILAVPAGSLDALFASLAAAEAGEPGGRTLLAFFGDSHTAGDFLTSHVRVTWQRRFGDAGRGLVAAGKAPARHYYQRDVRYGRTGTWTAAVGGKRGNREPFGIAGLRVSGQRKGAQLWVETCADCPAGTRTAQLEILYYAAPDHGVLRYRVDDGAWHALPTETSGLAPAHPAREVVPVPDGPHRLTLEHGGGGPIDLFGVVSERRVPGVIVDSLGVVGRRLSSLRSWDWSILGVQLATRDPDLVVLQYGTNEADDPTLVLADLATYYDDVIARIRAAVPAASILILGPPDMGVREAGTRCNRNKPPAGVDAGVAPECVWHTPAVLADIIAVQRAAAARNHVAFFDTFAAMGGADRMDAWALADPPIAYKDHVHFTDAGYRQWADALSGALLDEYTRWRRASGPR